MKTETKTIYKCDHCNKLYQRMHACEIHEKLCKKNPENWRACFGCNNLVKRKFIGKNLLFCSIKKQFMHTPQSEIKGNYYDLGEIVNNPMPKECSDFDGEIKIDFL